jgi:hypothetical protein
VALLGGTIVLFETQVMWDMDSPNAQAWNATLNASATGFNVIPIFILVIVAALLLGTIATRAGFRV